MAAALSPNHFPALSPTLREDQFSDLIHGNGSPQLHALSAQEGSLYGAYELPVYSSEVVLEKIETIETVKHDDYGTTYLQSWKMDDGTGYDILHGVAANPRATVPVVKDTAWGTQVAGLNTDVGRKLLKLGYDFVIKGPEKDTSIPLSQSAYNTHKILDAAHNLGWFDATTIAVEGYSRGAMIGFGTNAYAARFMRRVLYTNLTDPCIALPLGRNRATLDKAIGLPLDLAQLSFDVFSTIKNPRRAQHLLDTVDVSYEGLKQFVRTGLPLMDGEAGAMAARTPSDMQATVAFFTRCYANDRKVFQRILADRPGVRCVKPRGGHGKGIDEKIIENIGLRFGRLASQLVDENRSPGELDYRRIHLARSIELSN